jgi:hypothetical protein
VVEVCTGVVVVESGVSESGTVVDVVTVSSSMGRSDIDIRHAPGDLGALPSADATDATRTFLPVSVG